MGSKIGKSSLKVLDWTPFYIRNFWEKNVVNIGLSGGFIEPLESTGIGLISTGAWEFLSRIKTRNYDQHDIDLYNANMKAFFENSIDFVKCIILDQNKKVSSGYGLNRIINLHQLWNGLQMTLRMR